MVKVTRYTDFKGGRAYNAIDTKIPMVVFVNEDGISMDNFQLGNNNDGSVTGSTAWVTKFTLVPTDGDSLQDVVNGMITHGSDISDALMVHPTNQVSERKISVTEPDCDGATPKEDNISSIAASSVVEDTN